MAKIYIGFEIIGSGNLDHRNIVSARLGKDRYTPYSELRASVVLNNSINLNNIRRVALYIGTQRIIEYGKQLDTRSMLSKIYMKNVDGEYGYSYSSGKTIPHGITREKYYGLDKQWLNNVVVGLKDRIEFAEREYLVEHITYEGYCGEDITDKIICNGYGVNGKRVSRMEITVNSKGMQTKLLCE